jgi:hypothetical protein
MKTHGRQSRDDDQRLEGGNQPAKTPRPGRANLEQSIRELQATAGNRAVGDLVSGSGSALQRSFFDGPFGGLEDWLGEQSSGGTSAFDASSKAEAADASMKETPSDTSMKVADASDKWDASQKSDASSKWEPAEKFDTSDKWDASEKSEFDPAGKDEQLGSELEFEEF